MAIINSKKLDVIGDVALPGPADLVAYHSETDRVFLCDDDKPEMWVIDPMKKKIVSTINFPGGGMEDLGFDSQDTFLFQCLKDSSEFAKLDLKTKKVVAIWSTSPAILIDLDQAAQQATSWNPLITSSKIFDLSCPQGHFENYAFAIGCLLGVVSQAFVMHFDDLAVAHQRYFRTDF